MSNVLSIESVPVERASLTLDLDSIVDLSDDQLFDLCQRNPDLRIERTAKGELIVMAPAGGETSGSNAAITGQLWSWASQDRAGMAFDSSGGFILPNGAMRSPDASWVELERLRSLDAHQRKKFLPLCPTFVIELRSLSDTLSSVETKLDEYLDNGARLGWLIDPIQKNVHIYRPGSAVETLAQPSSVAGAPELPGFVLHLSSIWRPWI